MFLLIAASKAFRSTGSEPSRCPKPHSPLCCSKSLCAGRPLRRTVQECRPCFGHEQSQAMICPAAMETNLPVGLFGLSSLRNQSPFHLFHLVVHVIWLARLHILGGRSLARKRPLEKTYYEPVRQFLRREKECVVESYNRDGSPRRFIGKGLGGLIVDVFGVQGVKETGSRTLEGLAVEVKRSTSRTSLRHLVQAGQYGRLAHRCYLAQPRRFDQKAIMEASRFGIGLLQIKKSRVKVVSESRRFTPDPDIFQMFLHKSLRIVRCTLCSCHLFRYGPHGPGVVVNGHWVDDKLSPPRPKGKLNKKMYICPKCETLIAEIGGSAQFKKPIERLSKRVSHLERKLKRKKGRVSNVGRS